jgi:hypothetical protein
MSRLTCRLAMGLVWLGALWAFLAVAAAADVEVSSELRAEVVVAGVPRPVQLAVDSSAHLVILSHGWRGDAAAELYRFDLAALPLDASRAPRVVLPFSQGPRKIAFGSLALDPRSGDVFMGEENGNRVYRLTAGGKLALFGVGLNHLLGGSSLTFDRSGRLIVLDYTSPEVQQRSENPLPASFEALGGNVYQGPVVFRLDPREDVPLPRRFDLVTPILPKGSVSRAGVEPPFRFISAATTSSDGIIVLDSVGQLFALASDAVPRLLARLPSGHYHRTHMATGPDGSVFVSSGFQIRQIFRVSPAGVVSVVARDLGDPEGIAVDDDGALYVAENARHRVIRIRPPLTPPQASRR